ncbi:MAG: hypothetical protein JW727_02445 [Candidatus Aenigmarchaeota archaeon]|nr:hypothetical protein [Candidatus Aenigmarchaeota archaeon]
MQERLVARKSDIKTLYSGQYTIQEGFNPNYIEVDGERLSRVRVMATVIDKFLSEDGNYGTLTLDDGVDTIRLKAFQDLRVIEAIEKGDTVDVIAKIREYNGERYLQPEIVAKVEDPNFEVLRKLELRKLRRHPASPESAQPTISTAEQTTSEATIEKTPAKAESRLPASEEPENEEVLGAEEPKEDIVVDSEPAAEALDAPAPVTALAEEEKKAKSGEKHKAKAASEQKKLA